MMKIFIMSVFFLSGNYLFQFMLDDPNYIVATERTFFMAVAIAFAVFITKMYGASK